MTDFRTRLPQALYTAAQVRELDRLAIEMLPVSALELMWRAAAAVLALSLDRFPGLRHLIVYAGTGNNGGDGCLLAILAQEQGLKVAVVQVGDTQRITGDSRLAHQLLAEKGLQAIPFSNWTLDGLDGTSGTTVVIDGLLGTGLRRQVADEFAAAITQINASGLPVVAIDLPSGICSDTGTVRGCGVRATCTAVLVALKRGLLTGQALDHCGELSFFNLEVGPEVTSSDRAPQPDCRRIDMQSVMPLLPVRKPSSHKGDHGHTVVIGGDLGFGGAAIMAAEAALRSGSGLVSLVTRPLHLAAALARRPELMVCAVDAVNEQLETVLARASVLVIGPGLGQSDWSRTMLQCALGQQMARALPLVLDADALNLLADSRVMATGARRPEWVLTPHPGEAARMLGSDVKTVNNDRFAAVRELQSRWGGAVLLKGAGSLLCFRNQAGQQLRLCSAGNPGMASGGMGDVLGGLTGALLAQGLSPPDALQLAVCLHGGSGDLAASARGQRGLLATDLFAPLAQLLNPGP